MNWKLRFWEKEYDSINCANCHHAGRNHKVRRREPPWPCKKCDCKQYLREDMGCFVTCTKCGIKYFATSAGNPDGVSFCPNGDLEYPFDAYCPTADGGKMTPEEWDRTHGEKEE